MEIYQHLVTQVTILPSYMFFNNVTSLTNNNNSNTNIYTVVSQWYSDPNAAQSRS